MWHGRKPHLHSISGLKKHFLLSLQSSLVGWLVGRWPWACHPILLLNSMGLSKVKCWWRWIVRHLLIQPLSDKYMWRVMALGFIILKFSLLWPILLNMEICLKCKVCLCMSPYFFLFAKFPTLIHCKYIVPPAKVSFLKTEINFNSNRCYTHIFSNSELSLCLWTRTSQVCLIFFDVLRPSIWKFYRKIAHWIDVLGSK